jgi:hypothetical protein
MTDSLPRSAVPRMPVSEDEARRVFARWDRLNGRYDYIADVRFADGAHHRNVVFDADTNIAVEINGGPVFLDPTFFARAIAAVLVTRDRSPGHRRAEASDEQRDAFERSG